MTPSIYHFDFTSPFYPILDTAILADRQFPIADSAKVLLDSGAGILQYRHKGEFTRERLGELEEIASLVAKYECLLVVNDRADLAALFEAAVHVGQDDLTPTECRRIMPFAIGLSTHNQAQLIASESEPANYVALGPIFATASKDDPDAEVGLEHLRQWRKLASRPLVAIGGIRLQDAPAVLQAGADTIAVISDLYPHDGGLAAVADRARQWSTLKAF